MTIENNVNKAISDREFCQFFDDNKTKCCAYHNEGCPDAYGDCTNFYEIKLLESVSEKPLP